MLKKFKLVLGLLFIASSFIFAFFSFSNITGYAIIENIGRPGGSIIAVALLIIGVLILAEDRGGPGELEKTLDVDVYKARVKNEEKNLVWDRDYFIIDKKSALGKQIMSLGEFKRAYHQLGKDSELVVLIKEEYTAPLLNIHSEGGERAEVAGAFLDALGVEYNNQEENREVGYGVSREARKELKDAFRQFNGTIDKRQKAVLEKVGVYVEEGAKHHLFVLKENGETILTSSRSTNNPRGGLNMVRDLINNIEKAKNRGKN